MKSEDYQTTVSRLLSPTYEYLRDITIYDFISIVVSVVWIVTSISVLLFSAPLLESGAIMILGYFVARVSGAFDESSTEGLKTGISHDMCRHSLNNESRCSECGEETDSGEKILSYTVLYFMNYELARSLRTENTACKECNTKTLTEEIENPDRNLEAETNS